MANHKPFRELVKPNSNFEFVEKRKTWGLVSVLLILGSIGMLFINKQVRGDYLNWTIDFKGGTEIIFAFEDPETGAPVEVDSGQVRSALKGAGAQGFAVSDFSWEKELPSGKAVQASGMLVRTPAFGAVSDARQRELAQEFVGRFSDEGVEKAVWSGDRLFVRAGAPIDWTQAQSFFAEQGLELRPWEPAVAQRFATAEEGTNEYKMQFAVRGIDAQYQSILEEALGAGTAVKVVNVYGVGAKAGAKLRNDGIKSLFYATALILLYLAFRFDIRYAPGAVAALLHDSILVVGAFALSWQEVSLTTVAALLTVIGYSVNDTVVIFDRIRENVDRLKDKKFSRVINISLNETMSRTLLTSMTLFVVTLMMNIFGTGLVRNFAFALNVGIVVGVYSSIFVASPVALSIHNRFFSAPAASSKK